MTLQAAAAVDAPRSPLVDRGAASNAARADDSPAIAEAPSANRGAEQAIESPPSSPVTAPVKDPVDETDRRPDQPWKVIVLDDPVNLMSYVTYVFRKLFGFSQQKAHRLMMQVHNEGKAVVASGPKEKAEFDVYRLHEHGLWAILENDR